MIVNNPIYFGDVIPKKVFNNNILEKIIKQGINNCFLVHKYEHPGYENGYCAGLRTLNGDGEPVYKCQNCCLNYMYWEELDK